MARRLAETAQTAQWCGMPSTLTLDAAGLAPVLEAALQRLGELGQPGIDAFVELVASRGECPDFDAGVDLLDTWIGNLQIGF